GLLGIGGGRLCLLGGAATGPLDVRHADDGQILAMAVLDASARLGPVLEDDDLLATVGPQHLAGDLGSLNDGRPNQCVLAVGDEQDAANLDAGARIRGKLIKLELCTKLDAVLLAAVFDYCVHGT